MAADPDLRCQFNKLETSLLPTPEVRVLDDQRPDMEHLTTSSYEMLEDSGRGVRPPGGIVSYPQVRIVVEPVPGSIR
jgi:hypothetical protein